MLLINVALFVTVVGLFMQRQHKRHRLYWAAALGLVLFLLYFQVRGQLLVYSYRTLLFFSPLLVLFLIPFYGYKRNWMNVRKNNIALFFLMLGAFIALLVYSDVIQPLFAF